MAEQYDALSPDLAEWIGQQHVFFVATAAREGRINLSPKGQDSLRVLNEREILWLNLSGSGNETAAHLLDINRMSLMWCDVLRLRGALHGLRGRPAGADAMGGEAWPGRHPRLLAGEEPAEHRRLAHRHRGGGLSSAAGVPCAGAIKT